MATSESKPRRSAHTTAWLLLLAFLACLTLPMLTRRGMFIDGIFFAAVSRNLAVGIGDAWHLQYSETFMTQFREHPPLGFVLESWWFRVLGDHYWVERLYSLSTAVVSGGLMILLWRQLAREHHRVQACAWLPILLWVLMHGWRGAYGNNLLENTLGCFTLLAVYSLIRVIDGRAALWLPVAALSIVAALFTKGPVGLFPLATPAIAWLTVGRCGGFFPSRWSTDPDGAARPYRLGRLVVLQTVLLALVVAGAAAVLQNADARQFVREYWQQQVVASLSGQREIVASTFGRLFIFVSLANALLVPAAIAVLSVAIARWRKLECAGAVVLGRPVLFCLLTGLSASLPLAISPKQRGFYTAPSWPFFALALALWCAPAMLALLDRHYSTAQAPRRHLVWRMFAGVVAIAASVVAIVLAGAAQRDRAALADAAAIAQHVPPHTTLTVTPGLGPSGAMHAYLYRTHYISVSVDDVPPQGRFRLEAKTPATNLGASGSEQPSNVVLSTDRVVLREPTYGENVTAAAHDRPAK